MPTKRSSTGLTAKIDAAALRVAQAQLQPTLQEKVIGYVALALWVVFMVADFFGWAPGHDDGGLAHIAVMWMPLLVALAALARTTLRYVGETLTRLRKLRSGAQ